MTTFPNAPRLIKGALVGVDPLNPLASVVVFQYNPDTMTRRLEARAATGEGERGEAQRLSGPPKETITLSVEIDATDQLEQAQPLAPSSSPTPSSRSSARSRSCRWKGHSSCSCGDRSAYCRCASPA
jgi:hypothetical protein